MTASGADLQVGEVRWQVRVSVAVGRLHPDRRRLAAVACRPVAELAVAVASPGVNVAVAAQGQGMIGSCADLQVGEILRQIRIRAAVGLPHHDRRTLVVSRPVPELAVSVVPPGVGVPVTAHRQGKKTVC